MRIVVVIHNPCDAITGRQLRSGHDNDVDTQLAVRLVASGSGECHTILGEIRDRFCVESDLTWIHYVGSAAVERRAGGAGAEGHSIFETPILMPDDTRPLSVAELLDLAALSPADEVVISLDVQVTRAGWLPLVERLAGHHLGPTATLIAVESQAPSQAFTRNVAGLLASRPELLLSGALCPTLARFAGRGALVTPAVACPT